MVQLSHPYMTTGKTIALTRQTLVGKVVSLLFNMLFRLVTIFLPRSKVKVKSLGRVWLFVTPWTVAYQAPPSVGFSKEQASFNFLAAITICSDFGDWKNKSVTVSIVPHLFAMKWWDQMRLFSSLMLSAIRVVSSAYLRLLIFLLEILIPACASPSLAFLMMSSAYKLNKNGDNIQPWHTPFLIWNRSCSMSDSNHCFLTCIQISQETGKVVFPSLEEFPTVCCNLHSQRF